MCSTHGQNALKPMLRKDRVENRNTAHPERHGVLFTSVLSKAYQQPINVDGAPSLSVKKPRKSFLHGHRHRVSCSPKSPQTHYTAEAGLELVGLPFPYSQVLKL